MSRSMRAVRTDWGPAASVFVPSDMLPQVIAAITGEEEGQSWTYSYSALDESFVLRVAKGGHFLNQLRTMDVGLVLSRVQDGVDPADIEACALNLKEIARHWTKFLDEQGGLEIWVDAN
ncbi:MAG: hypothetical protein ABFE07_29060 [Armatimonadia bacterium]